MGTRLRRHLLPSPTFPDASGTCVEGSRWLRDDGWYNAAVVGAQPGGDVPLSEDEQRILHEIERSFYENDPSFAQEVRRASLYRQAWRNCKLGGLGFLAGLVVLVTQFASSVLLGFAGFVIMLASAFLIERNIRRMGKAGLNQLSQSISEGTVNTFLTERRKDFGRRLRRDDD